MNAPVNHALLDRMVGDRVITPEQREAALGHVQAFGDRIEEALLESGVDETALLKYLAALHKTRFVSTDKLAKADIDPGTLEKIPKKLAVARGLFPVLFDPKTSVLSVVTADPADAAALGEAKLVSGVREIRTFVARPRAVKAAIAKAYSGDIHAFATLDKTAQAQFTTMLNVYERNLVSDESMAVALASEDQKRERVLSGEELESAGKKTSRSGSDQGYIETLNVLVSLLENSRQDLRGHSAQVSRLIRKLAERIGLSHSQLSQLQIAAFVHDLGKAGAYHLTPLNVAEYEGHASQAKKTLTSPTRLMEAVGLSTETKTAVEQMYERFDGQGFPNSLRAKDIALGARILAIADTYADLTQNPRNPFRKRLRPVEACEVLARYKGTVFDPNLVDLFKHTVTGEDLKARLLANRHRALIVDPDPEETTVLELRMVEQGFEVMQAHATEAALKALKGGEFEMVVSEIDFGGQSDGFALLAEARKHEWGKKLPWIFVTTRSGSADARRAFELGAADFMTKPVVADLLVAKLKQIMEREAVQGGGGGANRGVSGSLQEMGLPDMVQVLWHGRKSGSLKIRSGTDTGEIHFVNGQIHNAMWGRQRGEDAFYAMLGLAEGTFALDPNFKAESQVITASPEALLLEGMRRQDEGAR
jgi:response regulator RpfG family c-di-GMP phosphodiesterase